LRHRQLCALLAVGLAAAAEARAQTPGDPYEKINRRVFDASMAAEQKYFRPIARRYQSLTPGLLGLAIHNFITNLGEPIVVGNDILQFRVRRSADDLARLVFNTTFGIGGLVDVAKHEGLPHRDNDFGVTLGVWGVKSGPYLFLPVLGPSTVRDAIGMGVDSVAAPLNWVRFPGRLTLQVTTGIVGAFDSRVRQEGEMQAELSGATDPYATIRSDYLQSREAMIRGEEAAPVLAPLDEPGAAPPPPQSGAPGDGGQPPGPSALAAPPAQPLAMAAALAPPAPAAAGQDAAAADDPDLAMVTAYPRDRDPAATAVRFAGL
jgi:phospholipid-binding lipoprotein MlaA